MHGRLKLPLPTETRNHARQLRQAETDAERQIWYHLRGGRLNGYKFRRQHPVPPYIVDFYCDTKGLVVELDGSQHNVEADRLRTEYLQSKGLKVLRFWNDEVLQQTEAVLEAILQALEA